MLIILQINVAAVAFAKTLLHSTNVQQKTLGWPLVAAITVIQAPVCTTSFE